MKHLKSTVILSVLLVSLLLTGCFNDITKVYDGPPVVEFAQYDQPFSPGNNYTTTVNFQNDDETGVVELSFLLQLIHEHFGHETTIGFTVNEVERTNSAGAVLTPAAQAGVHFNVLTSNNQVAFPANSSTAYLDVAVLAANLEPGESVHFELELTDGNELFPSENYKTFTVIVNKAAG